MLKTIRNNILGFIVGFILGSLLVVFFSKFFVISARDVPIIDIISLIIITGLTYYIASVLDTKKEKNKLTKELYIRKLLEIEEKLDLLETKIQNRKCPLYEINSIISAISKKQQALFNFLKKYYKENEISSFDKKLKEHKKNLWTSCTMTPIDKKNNKGNNVEIVHGEVRFDEKIASQIMSIIEDYKNELFELQLYINNI